MTMRALKDLIYAAQGGNATGDTPTLLKQLRMELQIRGVDAKEDIMRAADERARMLSEGLRLARRVTPPSPWVRFKCALERVFDAIFRSYQDRCEDWLTEVCRNDPTDLPERRARFIEEALELVQALGMSESDVMEVVGYVFNRPLGLPGQEFGGAQSTLAVLAAHAGYDLMEEAEQELARVWQPEVMDKIRRKRATRHGRGPLPGDSPVEIDPGNGQASGKLVTGSITAEHIPSGDALVEERARLVADNEAAQGWGAAVGARHERIQEIDRELTRRGQASGKGSADGCCSGIKPCAHQRQSPDTICETCQRAGEVTDRILSRG